MRELSNVSKKKIIEVWQIITDSMLDDKKPELTPGRLYGWYIALNNIPGATDYHLVCIIPELLKNLKDFPRLKDWCDLIKNRRPSVTYCEKCKKNSMLEYKDNRKCELCGRTKEKGVQK